MEDKPPSSSHLASARSESPESVRQHSDSTSTTPKPRDSAPPLNPPAKKTATARVASSATSSPHASRESSPVRPPLKPNTSSARSSGPGRSRKNSVQDSSPSRTATSTNTNPPSAAATQRALSAASIPSLHPSHSDSTIKAPVPVKPLPGQDIKETPRWPVSPRLRSPPPVNNKQVVTSPRKTDSESSSANASRTESQESKSTTTDGEADDYLSITGMRTPARGASGSTLETVQEISLPNTPGPGLDGILGRISNGKLSDENSVENAYNKNMQPKNGAGVNNESGSESGGKTEKMRATSQAPTASTRLIAPAVKSYSTSGAVGVGRGKSIAEGIAKNMTVETETVSSIPQVPVGGIATGNGSIRTKPSSETIRPKKEKKKTARKAPSVNTGTVSSKADFFEATVASAVDEANSSDSEETFVYESNPPESSDRPRRFHSRTPSVTSMASQADQRGGRVHSDAGHSVAMKKSMKFANNYNNSIDGANKEDDGKGTSRSSAGTGRGTTHHHHHIGRWGRHGGNGHASLFDTESPFPNATKSKFSTSHNNNKQSSQPSSPRAASRATMYGKKQSPISSGYDMDNGADDERTPLIATIRSGRSGRNRRPGSSLRQLEHQASRQHRSFLARFAGCIVISLMIIMVFVGAIGFMFATTQPLSEVKVLALKNVLASEQEIIFDMKVTARNRNIVAVTVDTADIVVFAKSKYAGTDSEWWSHPQVEVLSRRDDVEDPIAGDPTTNPNLEIGQVYNLKSPLTFEGSPFHHLHTISLGQVRISHPGNRTTPSGSERWGRVLEHEFDLLLRGTLIYTLPLTQKIRSVSVEGRVTVKPNAADQDPDTITQPISDGSGGEVHISAT